MTINHFPDKIGLAMADSFEKKCDEVKKIFSMLSAEERYKTLIEMGRKLPRYPDELKTADRLVRGCQSILYLSAKAASGKMFFEAAGDALISVGLAALLIHLYSGEPPETILTKPPACIEELQIAASLSPHRSNGLSNIHLKMKQEAMKVLI